MTDLARAIKKRQIIITLLLGLLAYVFICALVKERNGIPEPMQLPHDPELEALVGRLAKAYRPPATLFGEGILYQPKEDKTVRAEVRAKGRKIVPYLIRGLRHKEQSVRVECAMALGDIPSKEGLSALVECLAESVPHDRSGLPRVFAVWAGIEAATGLRFAAERHDTDAYLGARRKCLNWWKANEDRIVDADDGIRVRLEDGRMVALATEFPEHRPP